MTIQLELRHSFNHEIIQVNDEEDRLISKAKAGDTNAFGAIVQRYQSDVRGYLRSRLYDHASADDLAQEVFVGAMNSITRLEKSDSLRSWLLSIARFKLIDYTRSANYRRTQAGGEIIDALAQMDDVDDCVDQGDVLEHLRFCLANLRPAMRGLIERYYFQRETANTIAKAVQKKPSAVRMTLMRIRKSLGKCIRQRQRQGN